MVHKRRGNLAGPGNRRSPLRPRRGDRPPAPGRATGQTLARRAFRAPFGFLVGSIWDPRLDRKLAPVFLTWFTSNIALSAFWGFVGIWAIEKLGASAAQLGVALFVSSAFSGVASYAGGSLSDRLGRRRVMVFSWTSQAAVLVGCALAGGHLLVGLALICLAGALGSPAHAAVRALVADAVPEQDHETAYASLRIAYNLALTGGPPLAGLLLLGNAWSRLFLTTAALVALSALCALLLPNPETRERATEAKSGSLRTILGEAPLVVFTISALFGWFAMVALDTMMPIAAVTVYGFSPQAWGLLAALNPVLVFLLQLRVTRATASVSITRKLVLGNLAMGLPFLLLLATSSVAAIVVVILVFVAGEMLWGPASQTVAARLAVPRMRGAFMGLYGATSSVGFALGPLVGLQLKQSAGIDAAWVFFAAIAVVAAAAAAAALSARTRPAAETTAAAS